ncbi:hypothetical protein C7B65_11825 [Phormidesmis priestleyi ULC007]|uniref:Uncharacterized protein n=1 Tax=Phormidesmis priestleyi ULC007 TaxID=1920490 RepID=A0A2T1DFK7_9CYAN|nr:hypothetical protein [Phormidesmis priestleyi]PSB19256.1 hypothetical protein C7B65_11825 [Phormidesmis priestleyi ULC007]PZO48211.1 MAG: hypothetical protein DCF14_17945 [Phormidesmis priestleyi]
MSQIDYAAMTDQQLKQYFLEHRNDKAALQAYLDRRNQRSKVVITTIDDPDFDQKIQAAIEQQISKSL